MNDLINKQKSLDESWAYYYDLYYKRESISVVSSYKYYYSFTSLTPCGLFQLPK